jgi:hypothetical protein
MALVAATVAVAATYTVRAAPQAGAPIDPIAALLSEVHALRMAMEQSATVAPRVQLTLARLNIEEQRIAQLALQLDQVRRELLAASQESQRLTDQLPESEKGLLTATDDKLRKMYEYEQREVKRKLGELSRLEQQLRPPRKRGRASTEHRAGSMDGAQCASRRTGAAARAGAPLAALDKQGDKSRFAR